MIGNKPVIYIVDDEASVRKALMRLMKSAGLDVETFASAEDFLSSGHQDKPGCLVLDVRMPGMTGFDLQEHLTVSGSRIPIIFITAHDDVQTRNRAKKTRAVAYIKKPFDDQSLLNAIQLALRKDKGP